LENKTHPASRRRRHWQDYDHHREARNMREKVSKLETLKNIMEKYKDIPNNLPYTGAK
jgi:hypothetical protein